MKAFVVVVQLDDENPGVAPGHVEVATLIRAIARVPEIEVEAFETTDPADVEAVMLALEPVEAART